MAGEADKLVTAIEIQGLNEAIAGLVKLGDAGVEAFEKMSEAAQKASGGEEVSGRFERAGEKAGEAGEKLHEFGEKGKSALEGVAASSERLVGALNGLSGAAAIAGFEGLVGVSETLANSFGALGRAAALIGGTFAAAAAGTAALTLGLGELAHSSAETVIELDNMAKESGQTFTQLYALKSVFADAGVGASEFGTLMRVAAIRAQSEWPATARAVRDAADVMLKDQIALKEASVALEGAEDQKRLTYIKVTEASNNLAAAEDKVKSASLSRQEAENRVEDAAEKRRYSGLSVKEAELSVDQAAYNLQILQGAPRDKEYEQYLKIEAAQNALEEAEKRVLDVKKQSQRDSIAEQKASLDLAAAKRAEANSGQDVEKAQIELNNARRQAQLIDATIAEKQVAQRTAEKKIQDDRLKDIGAISKTMEGTAEGAEKVNLSLVETPDLFKAILNEASKLEGGPTGRNIILATAQAFHRTGEEALTAGQKISIARQLAGRGASQETVNALSKGIEELSKIPKIAAEQAEALEKSIEPAERFKVELSRLLSQLEFIKITVGAAFFEPFSEGMEKWSKSLGNTEEQAKSWKGVMDALKATVTDVFRVLSGEKPQTPWVSALVEGFNTLKGLITDVSKLFRQIAADIAPVVSGINQLVTSTIGWKGAIEALIAVKILRFLGDIVKGATEARLALGATRAATVAAGAEGAAEGAATVAGATVAGEIAPAIVGASAVVAGVTAYGAAKGAVLGGSQTTGPAAVELRKQIAQRELLTNLLAEQKRSYEVNRASSDFEAADRDNKLAAETQSKVTKLNQDIAKLQAELQRVQQTAEEQQPSVREGQQRGAAPPAPEPVGPPGHPDADKPAPGAHETAARSPGTGFYVPGIGWTSGEPDQQSQTIGPSGAPGRATFRPMPGGGVSNYDPATGKLYPPEAPAAAPAAPAPRAAPTPAPAPVPASPKGWEFNPLFGGLEAPAPAAPAAPAPAAPVPAAPVPAAPAPAFPGPIPTWARGPAPAVPTGPVPAGAGFRDPTTGRFVRAPVEPVPPTVEQLNAPPEPLQIKAGPFPGGPAALFPGAGLRVQQPTPAPEFPPPRIGAQPDETPGSAGFDRSTPPLGFGIPTTAAGGFLTVLTGLGALISRSFEAQQKGGLFSGVQDRGGPEDVAKLDDQKAQLAEIVERLAKAPRVPAGGIDPDQADRATAEKLKTSIRLLSEDIEKAQAGKAIEDAGKTAGKSVVKAGNDLAGALKTITDAVSAVAGPSARAAGSAAGGLLPGAGGGAGASEGSQRGSGAPPEAQEPEVREGEQRGGPRAPAPLQAPPGFTGKVVNVEGGATGAGGAPTYGVRTPGGGGVPAPGGGEPFGFRGKGAEPLPNTGDADTYADLQRKEASGENPKGSAAAWLQRQGYGASGGGAPAYSGGGGRPTYQIRTLPSASDRGGDVNPETGRLRSDEELDQMPQGELLGRGYTTVDTKGGPSTADYYDENDTPRSRRARRKARQGVVYPEPSGGYDTRVDGGYEYSDRLYAKGGHVRGPGTSTSDSIPALLSHGEFVIRAPAVQHFGVGFMQAINSLRGFAAGGLVVGSLMPEPTLTDIPKFAAGGPASAATTQGRALTLVLDGQKFAGFSGPAHVMSQLETYAVSRRLATTGRQPSWKK